MTISIQTNKNIFNGDGSTRVWSYTFDFDSNLSDEYIKIYVSINNNTSTEITSNYEIDTENKEITYPTITSGLDPLTNNDKITIIRELPLTQDTSYTTQGIFPATSIEDNEDLAILKIQDLKEQVDRSYKKDLNTGYSNIDNVKSITFEDGSILKSVYDGGSVESVSSNTDVNITMNANDEATSPTIKFNNYQTTKSFINKDGEFCGDTIGDLSGNVNSLNGTRILYSGIDGTDAQYQGQVFGELTGDVIGNLIGSIYASDNINKILDSGTDGTDFSSLLCPAGSIQMFAGATAPKGFLLCDGAAISRTIYAALYEIIGETYGGGDGITTFNLPDMRESYAVGVGTYLPVSGTTHGNIIAHDSFDLGEFKDDQFQGFQGAIKSISTSIVYYGKLYTEDSRTTGTPDSGSGLVNFNSAYQGDISGLYPYADGTNGTPRMGTITRGKGIGLNFIIKY